MGIRLKFRTAAHTAPPALDPVPDAFAFTPQTNVALGADIVSATTIITGLVGTSPITVSGSGYLGSYGYSVNGGPFVTISGLVSNGDSVRARVTSSPSASTAATATVTIGGVSATFTATTVGAVDTVPNAFTFADQINAAVSTVATSPAITVAGLSTGATTPISITGGTYSKNSGAFVSSAGTVVNGDTIRARVTSSASLSTAVSCTVTIGGVSDTYTVTTSSGAQTVISPSDFGFDGWHTFGTNPMGNGGDAPVSFAIRYVGAKVHLFTWIFDWLGHYSVVEYRIDAAPQPTIPEAIELTYIRFWPDIRADHISVDGGRQGNIVGGMWWDETLHGLWWSYGSDYVPLAFHPTMGFTQLNDLDGTFTSYGPWRSDIDAPRFLGGSMAQIPSDYLSAFGGAKFVQSGVVYSGAAGCPQGINLHAIMLPNPFTEPRNTVIEDSNIGFTQKTIIRYDYAHPMYRSDINYAYCKFGDGSEGPGKYDPRFGVSITDGSHVWGMMDGGVGPSGASIDGITCCFFISTAAKRGMVFLGALMTTPAGYTPVGDDKVHFGYAPNNYASATGATAAGFQDNYCPHGQIMAKESWGSTGPFCGYTASMLWIYDPNDLVNATSLGGAMGPRDFTPVHNEVPAAPYVSALSFPIATSVDSAGSQAAGNVGGGVWDPVNKKIYLPIKIDFDTVYGTRRYAMAQISVAA